MTSQFKFAKTRTTRSPSLLLFVLILLVGSALRVVGLDFGAPLAIKADEPIIIYNILYMFENRTFEPDTFQWPGHLLMQLGYFAVTVYSYLFLGIRPEEAISIYPEETWYPAVRFVTALFGIAAIVLSYFIGRFFNQRVALIAAGLFAFFPYFVEHSHYATVDMGLTALSMGVILAAMYYLRQPSTLILTVMAIVSGAAFTMKYPGILTTVIIAAVVISASIRDKKWWRIVGHGFLSVLWVGLSAFLISPALLTNRHEVIRSIGNESKTQHPGADGRNLLERVEFYASSYLSVTGLLLLIPLIVGLVFIIRQRALIAVPILFGLFYWVALSFLALYWLRWGLPMFVAPLIVSAIGFDRLISWGQSVSQSWKKFSLVVGTALSALSLAFSAVAETAYFLSKDTRVEALSHFEAKNITADTAYYEGYTPIDAGTLGKVFGSFRFEEAALVPKDPSKDFVVLSSGTYARYFADQAFMEERRFYEVLEAQFPESFRKEPSLFVVDPVRGTRGQEFEGDPTIVQKSSPLEGLNIYYRWVQMTALAGGASTGPVIRVLDLQRGM